MREKIPKAMAIIERITVEPVAMLYWLGLSLYFPVYSQLIEQHICRQLDAYPHSVCANLSAYPDAAAHVRGQWAVWDWYVGATNTPCVIIFHLFVAPWSDRYGRKWMMLSAPAFALVAAVQLLANVYWPDLPIWQLLLVMIPVSVSGGAAGLRTACRSYVADVSNRGASLSIRMMLLGVSMGIGGSLGGIVGSVLYERVGPVGPFVLYFFCSLSNIIYILVRVKDTSKESPDADDSMAASSRWERVRALLDINLIRRMWHVLSRKREGMRRRLLLIYVGTITCDCIINTCNVGLPFYEGPPINWTLSEIMLIFSIWSIIGITNNLVLFPLIKLKLRINDGTLTVISALIAIIGHSVMFNARSGLYILALTPLMFLSYGGIAQMALLSRSVEKNEQGSLFGAITIIEHVLPLGASYVSARIFEATARAMPTLLFGIGAVLSVIPLSLYCWADVLDRRGGMSETL